MWYNKLRLTVWLLAYLALGLSSVSGCSSMPDTLVAHYISEGLKYQYTDNNRAIYYYTQAIDIEPNNKLALSGRALTYGRVGNYRNAIADYTKLISISPNELINYSLRSACYYEIGEYDKAISDSNLILKNNPKDKGAFYRLGMASNGKREYDTAIMYYSEAIRMDPKYTAAFEKRGTSFMNKGDYSSALEDFNIAINMGSFIANASRGILYYELGMFDNAIDDFNTNIDRMNQLRRLSNIQQGETSDSVYFWRGMAYAGKNDYEMAIADVSLGLRISPENSMGYVLRGNIYAQNRMYNFANADYINAIQADQRNAAAYYYRSLLNLVLNDYEKALYNIEEAFKLNGKYESIRNIIAGRMEPEIIVFDLDIRKLY
jgi:tetratricopeptide (TPR) repeat protein